MMIPVVAIFFDHFWLLLTFHFMKSCLGGGFKDFVCSSVFGEMIQFH